MTNPDKISDTQLDTSLPGREEEVIKNGEEIKKTESIKTILTTDDAISNNAEKTFEEGLQNNSDTDETIV